MIKIVSTYTLDDNLMARIKEKFGDGIEVVKIKEFDNATGEEKRFLKEAEVLLFNKLEAKVEDFDEMENLKWIQCVFSGINHLPLKYLEDRGIILTNARGVHRIQMSEYAMGLLLMIVRRSAHYVEAQKNRKWDPVKIDELYGKTVGFIGVGAVAREIARKLKAFDVRIIGVKNTVEPVENFDEVYGTEQLDTLLEQSDFVVTLVPLTDDTYKMIGEEQFKKMKKTAWFINIARGDVVDEAAMVKTLKEGRIAGAALDVFEKEPLPEDSPLWGMENVILTPHIAGPTPHYMDRLMDIFIINLESFGKGEREKMINVIDYGRQY